MEFARHAIRRSLVESINSDYPLVMKPLILHIRACNFFGGPERQILGHIEESKNVRHMVLTFVEGNRNNDFYERCKEKGVPVAMIKTRNSFDPRSIAKVRRVIKRNKPAMVCCHGYRPLILSLLARLGTKVALIAFCRGHTHENVKVRLFEEIERRVLRFTEAIVVVSHGYRELLYKEGVPASKIWVVQNAVNGKRMERLCEKKDKKRAELGFSPNEILIATAGRLSPEKGQADLIVAFSLIQGEFPSARLLFLGDGPLRKRLEILARKSGVRRINFLGFRDDIDEIMSSVDIFVLPSYTEGLPNVILEAFACGKPVIATRVGGVIDVVEDGNNGFLVYPHRPDLLAKAMSTCLSSPGIIYGMGRAGYEKVNKEFTVEAQTMKLEKVYNDVLAKVGLRSR